jgi:urate oxidase
VKNTVYVYSKTSPYVLDPPAFALDLAMHFVNKYEHISKAFIDIISHKWSRIQVGGKDHKWSFVRDGDEKRTVECMVDGSAGKENLTASLKCGLKDLLGRCYGSDTC